MARHLLVSVHLHEGRYHGMGEWLPSPARLFQALVAGAAAGGGLEGPDRRALEWLENLEPPTIAAPRMSVGQRVKLFVPDNDLDSVGCDPVRAAEIRSGKTVEPRLFDPAHPFLFAWALADAGENEPMVSTACELTRRLYQFGRGVDMAWATGEILDERALEDRLSCHPGAVLRPTAGGGRTLACPCKGSLASLMLRHDAALRRFRTDSQDEARHLFFQPPRARFVQVAYESSPSRRVYDLRERSSPASFGVWQLTQATGLAASLRDGAAGRLRLAFSERASEVERVIVGRKANGSDDGPTRERVRIVPLASIGHPFADHGIRRVLVEVPAECPLRADDVHWAFSGLELRRGAETEALVLTASGDGGMLEHYGAADRAAYRRWRTVTPAALPEAAGRRRIDPARVDLDAKGGPELAAEQLRASAAVTLALRHAEVWTPVEAVRVQREPFESKGARAESFAVETRFSKQRLWHVEIRFARPISGPLVIGDGRFLGLGVMAPLQRCEGVHAFVVEGGLPAKLDPRALARALRRTVMARVQERLGARVALPAFFSGHEPDGSPARSQSSPHLTYTVDPARARLLIVAPHVVGRRSPRREELAYLRDLDAALSGGLGLRAGRFDLRSDPLDLGSDPLFAASRTWQTVSPYHVTRHSKGVGAAEALAADVRAECRRHGLPDPVVRPRDLRGVSGVGLVGGARLSFHVAVTGPITLGRSRHLGGGLFEAVRSETDRGG